MKRHRRCQFKKILGKITFRGILVRNLPFLGKFSADIGGKQKSLSPLSPETRLGAVAPPPELPLCPPPECVAAKKSSIKWVKEGSEK